MNTINASDFLSSKYRRGQLCFYQKEHVFLIINDFIETNKQMDIYHFEHYPKCGAYHLVLVKAGKAKVGNRCLSEMRAINDLHVIMVS